MDGWSLAKSLIAAGHHRLIILDEFTYAINFGMVDEREAMEALRNRPEGVHILVTGRDAPEGIIELADLVTEMGEVKHPFKAGIKAQMGIEW